MNIKNQIQWDLTLSRLKMYTKDEMVIWKLLESDGTNGRI